MVLLHRESKGGSTTYTKNSYTEDDDDQDGHTWQWQLIDGFTKEFSLVLQ